MRAQLATTGYEKEDICEAKGFILRGSLTRQHDEQERRSEKLWNVLAELKIQLMSVGDSHRHQVISVSSRGLDAVAVEDDKVEHPTQSEHRIETGKRLNFRNTARPLPSELRIFIERAEQTTTPRRYLLREARRMPIPLTDCNGCQKGWNPQNVCGLQATQRDDNQKAYSLPRINEIFTSLHNAYSLLTLDLQLAYPQIPVPVEELPKNAFIPHKGLSVF